MNQPDGDDQPKDIDAPMTITAWNQQVKLRLTRLKSMSLKPGECLCWNNIEFKQCHISPGHGSIYNGSLMVNLSEQDTARYLSRTYADMTLRSLGEAFKRCTIHTYRPAFPEDER